MELETSVRQDGMIRQKSAAPQADGTVSARKMDVVTGM